MSQGFINREVKNNTREKILYAARCLFVEHGFAGTSMGKIGKLAQVTHSLLFHHFKNKENLWQEVKQLIARDDNHISRMLPERSDSFDYFLNALFHRCVSFYRSHPDIIKLINWQRVESTNHPAIGVGSSSDKQEWIDTFKYYQACGDIKPDIDPEYIVTMILSLVSSIALDNHIYITQQNRLDDYILFCCAAIKKAICP